MTPLEGAGRFRLGVNYWPAHVGPYMRIAYDELVESIGRNVLPDGGNAEGAEKGKTCIPRNAVLFVAELLISHPRIASRVS